MKIIKKISLLTLILLLTANISCSDNPTSFDSGKCLANSLELTETKVDVLAGQHSIIVTFDVTNNSSFDYSVQNGSAPIYTTMTITTKDGTKYETTNILALTSLSSGATASVSVLGSYGTNKEYSDYKITLSCQ